MRRSVDPFHTATDDESWRAGKVACVLAGVILKQRAWGDHGSIP